MSLHDLDPDQQTAVGGILSEVLSQERWFWVLIAMAGSGKTRSLTALVRELIALGENPEGIVAISFTNKAADELRDRLMTQLGAFDASRVRSSTFHRFCMGLLPDGGRDIMDEDDASRWFSQWVADRAADEKLDWAEVFFGGGPELQRLVSLSKQSLMTPKDSAAIGLSKSQTQRLADAWEAYESWKDEQNKYDTDDLQWRLWLAMRADPTIAERAQSLFKWFAVDEAQDLSPIQMHLARELAGRHLIMVGDPNQSIYGFRGARRAMLISAATQPVVDGRNVRVYWLPRNYRATSTLVSRGNKVLGLQRDKQMLKPMRPTQDSGPDVSLDWYPDPQTEAERVADQIKDLVQSGTLGHEIVVLTRTNSRSILIAQELADRNVPYVRASKSGFWGMWPVRQAVAYLRVVKGSTTHEDLELITKAPRLYWSKANTAQLETKLVATGDVIIALQEQYATKPGTRAAAHLARILLMVRSARSPSLALRILYDAQSVDWDESRRETFYTAGADRRSRGDSSRRESLDQLLEIARSYNTVEAFLAECDLRARKERLLLQKRDKSRPGHVSVMSIHRVKGLEFDHVYLLGMTNELMPHKDADPDEEARALYVAVTRARRHLTISWTGDHPVNSASPYLRVWPDLVGRLAGAYDVEGQGTAAARGGPRYPEQDEDEC